MALLETENFPNIQAAAPYTKELESKSTHETATLSDVLTMLRVLICLPNDVLYSQFERNKIHEFICGFKELAGFYKCDDVVTIFEASTKFCKLVKRPFLMVIFQGWDIVYIYMYYVYCKAGQ